MFLCSELQAAQIVYSRQVAKKQQGKSTANQDLQAICETLQLPEPKEEIDAVLFSEVENKVCFFSSSLSFFIFFINLQQARHGFMPSAN